jgi:hypothetical protein
MQGVVDNNSNRYKRMIMDATRINQDYTRECLTIDEKLNTYATRFFELLKDSDKSLWDGCINHSKLSIVAQVLTIKLDHELSEASYNRIVE